MAALVLVVGLVLFRCDRPGRERSDPTTVPGFRPRRLCPGSPPRRSPGAACWSLHDHRREHRHDGRDGATATSAPAADSSDSADPNAERTVWFAIAGLGVVAFLIIVLTIVYARHTRPDRWHGGQDEWDVPDSPDDVRADRGALGVRAPGGRAELLVGREGLSHPTGRRRGAAMAWGHG